MSDFKKVVKGLEDKIETEEKQTGVGKEQPKLGSFKSDKPLMKDDVEQAKKLGMDKDEYKYQSDTAMSILLGRELPKKSDYTKQFTGLENKIKRDEAHLETGKGGVDGNIKNSGSQTETQPIGIGQKEDKGVHYKPTEKEQDYNDYYGAKTWSERELNLATHNDQRTYDFIRENKRHLLELADTDPEAAVRALLSRYPYKDHGITANNISKSYLKKLIEEFEPDEDKKPMRQVSQTATPEQIASQEFGKPFTKSNYDDNIYETEDGEEWFIGDKKQALGYAWEQVDSLIDSMGIEGFNQDFQDWIIDNAVDDNFIHRLQSEDADYYRQEGDEEFASWINNMTAGQYRNHLIDNYGAKEFYDLITRNNAFNKDKIIREVINMDGIANSIATYDGKEIELPNGLLAYRLN